MNKLQFYAMLCALMCVTQISFAQKIDKPGPDENDDHGRENWVLPHGNVGLNMGKNMATERLHVNGNLRVSQTIFTDLLEASKITIGTLNSSTGTFREGLTAGNTSINGVLTVTGSLTGQSATFTGITSSGAVSFGNNLTVSGLSLFNGGTTIHGDAMVSNIRVNGTFAAGEINISNLKASGSGAIGENFEVGGWSKIIGDLTVGGHLYGEDLSFKNVNVSNNATVNDLIVNGGLSAQAISVARLTSSGNASIGNGLSVTGATLLNGDLTVSGAINGQNLSVTDLNASQNVSVLNQFSVTGLSLLSGGATVGGTSTMNDVQVNGTFNAGTIGIRQLNVSGPANIGGTSTLNDLQVTGVFNAETTGIQQLNVSGEASVGENLIVVGHGQVGGDFTVLGSLNTKQLTLDDIETQNNVVIGNGLSVTGQTNLHGGATITGNSSMNGDLQITGNLSAGAITLTDINSNGNATITQNLTVNGLSEMAGDLQVSGNIKAGVVEATEFRSVDGAALSLENAKITNTLSVASDRVVPSNYRLAVGGNIIATGIDIKIPQKWPDYVFTDGYKILTINEVEAYIKKHGHLPGVLSASEMRTQENYSVSEMDAKLLEKVEELTLYIIELKKEIELLKKKQD